MVVGVTVVLMIELWKGMRSWEEDKGRRSVIGDGELLEMVGGVP